MAAEKKGFVLYFDACRGLDALEPEQRGWVLTVLIAFAKTCAKDPRAEIETTLAQFPQLKPETQMACYFLCETILRDTVKWWDRRAHYVQAAQARQEQKSGGQYGRREMEESAWGYVNKD